MTQDEREKNYTKILLQKLIENKEFINYDLIEECFSNILKSGNRSSTLDQVSQFTESFSRDLNLALYQIKEEKNIQATQRGKYVINGIELCRDYYSIRTDAPRILGVTGQTLNSKVNQGIIKCLPGFKTKTVSPEELYNYWKTYLDY